MRHGDKTKGAVVVAHSNNRQAVEPWSQQTKHSRAPSARSKYITIFVIVVGCCNNNVHAFA